MQSATTPSQSSIDSPQNTSLKHAMSTRHLIMSCYRLVAPLVQVCSWAQAKRFHKQALLVLCWLILLGGDCIYGHALPRGACSTFTCFWFIWCLCNTLYWPWHRLYGVVDVLARLVGNTWHRIYRSSHFGTGMVPTNVDLVMDVNLCQWRTDFKPQFNPSFCRV